MSRAEATRYVVTTSENVHPVEAAYFQHEEDFTVFKGADGAIAASFANTHIVAIERVADHG